MKMPKLTIEILSGPYDGKELTIEADSEWSREGSGAFAFPWDDELGRPQAHLTVDEQGWWLEPVKSAHGTYRISQGEKLQSRIQLTKGDILNASTTWWLVKSVE